jgi:hypothetical protein
MQLLIAGVIEVVVVPEDCLFGEPHHMTGVISNYFSCQITTQLKESPWHCHLAIFRTFSIHFLSFILTIAFPFRFIHIYFSFFSLSTFHLQLQLRIRTFLSIFSGCGKQYLSSIGCDINERRMALLIFIEMRMRGVC